jgi:hypothetical protein
VKLGWLLLTTFSGGLLPLRGVLMAGELGTLLVVAPGALFSGDAMTAGHLARPARSSIKKHVGYAAVLLLVPFLIFEASSSGGRSDSTRLIWSPATRNSGRNLQGSECNFPFFQGCLCKCWVVIIRNICEIQARFSQQKKIDIANQTITRQYISSSLHCTKCRTPCEANIALPRL